MSSTVGMVLMGIIALVCLIMWKRIGRGILGVITFIAVAFFVFFMVDNFTGANLRQYLPWAGKQYDETLKNPTKKAKEVAAGAESTGKKAVGAVDEVGSTLDDEFGIKRTDKGSKEWSTSAKENETTTQQKATDTKDNAAKQSKSSSTKNSQKVLFIAYDKISGELKNNPQLKNLSAKDKALIQGMLPLVKTQYTGSKITVNNSTKTNEGITIVFK